MVTVLLDSEVGALLLGVGVGAGFGAIRPPPPPPHEINIKELRKGSDSCI
tara:strand:+ start:304 stop:453 length:150 start_codon:yes stop_codon:yes gene_type:complete